MSKKFYIVQHRSPDDGLDIVYPTSDGLLQTIGFVLNELEEHEVEVTRPSHGDALIFVDRDTRTELARIIEVEVKQ